VSADLAALLAAAEPVEPRPLDGLVVRLRALDPALSVVVPAAGGDALDVPAVRGVTADSRAVPAGALFVAIPGGHADGHAFAAAAVRAGASAILVDHALPDLGVPQIVVAKVRPALAEAAAWWYGDPSRSLGVVGITGTDGKTTTSFMAAAAFARAGIPVGLVGTVATQIGGRREAKPEHGTTPEAPALQRALLAMVRAGDRAAVIETTSHGLAMDRVAAIGYDVAIFTNLTHEHLELHGTFEAYRAAKVSLFERLAVSQRNPAKSVPGWPRTGIVNADDPSAPAFEAATRRAAATLLTYGRAERADIRLTGSTADGGGQALSYLLRGAPRSLRLRMSGLYNAHNALAAVALGAAIGLDPGAVEAGLAEVVVPGRMQRIKRGQPFDVVVDYAHGPASLALVLDELAAAAAARGGGLIAVFGSAGERDVEKRPLMGRVAAERCRRVIVTDEDPRGEDRDAILRQIAAGAHAAAAPGLEAVEQIADRGAAIREALRRAGPGDAVLLAGKGHESTILYADHAQPWDEAREVATALGELGWTG
jgi:UDP-N-acetylmuramoyl-L-alanyl-D-glutamate--2,6-diaminopimelate ligase